MFQAGYTPLTLTTIIRSDNLPMVECLVERGAPIEAKDNNVSDIDTKPHIHHTSSVWKHIIDACCKERPFANGRISVGEES